MSRAIRVTFFFALIYCIIYAATNKGATLFKGRQRARGIFVLCQDKIKLSVCSESGKRITLRIVGPGEVLGLSAAFAGTPHETTAQSLDNAQVAFVKRKDLLRFLHEHHLACLQVVNLLSQDLGFAYDRVRSVGLTRSRRPRATRVH